MQSARPCRLRSHNLRNLELPLCVRRPHNCLELAALRRFPGVVPDDPGEGRHGLFDFALVPCPAGVEAQFNFADAIGPAEGDSPEFLLDSAKRLIMSRGI